MKRIIKLLSIALAICLLIGCSKTAETAATTEATTEATTVTTTIERTTEDEKTTFPETQTAKIHEGLVKDESDYPYQIASYTTTYNATNKTRTANLKAAINKINNIKVPDGAIFSFNQTVGKRTVTAGYEEALVIKDGEFVDGLGGGVCQISSTIFECVLRANVEIVKRTYHSLEIGYVPLGGDATVQWNSKDFQWKNNLGCDTKLVMTCNNGKIVCKLMAKKNINPGKVEIKIVHNDKDDSYTLTRYVNGKSNYTTYSKYKKAEH